MLSRIRRWHARRTLAMLVAHKRKTDAARLAKVRSAASRKGWQTRKARAL